MTTLIVGGGLAGLALAQTLEAQGRDYVLVEARERFGGRILSTHVDTAAFDLGPTWFWPGQPRIAALIDHLGLARFDQFAHGLGCFEDERGRVRRGPDIASMQGAWRVEGGLSRLTDTLVSRLAGRSLRPGAKVSILRMSDHGISATLGSGEVVQAARVVLALPPRLAARITFSPSLAPAALWAMRNIPTWMAGQAKALAVYDAPVWRLAGCSGDAISRRGPLVEVHDASPARNGPFALFGFIGTAPAMRRDQDALREAIRAQLGRLFGVEALTPRALVLKDWACDDATATDADQQMLFEHPQYGLPAVLSGLWQGRLLFAGSEVAPQFGGYLEGALEAAAIAAATLSTA